MQVPILVPTRACVAGTSTAVEQELCLIVSAQFPISFDDADDRPLDRCGGLYQATHQIMNW